MSRRRRAAACASLAGLLALAAASRAEDPFLRRTATVRVVEKVGPAVVNVTTERAVRRSPFRPFGGDPFFDRFFQDFFEPGLPETVQSLGSGVVIDADRHVLTNEHVIAGAETVRVTLSDGREYEASLVGADPNHDLAVLRIETRDAVPWVAPGRSEGLMVGEPLVAIGNPFGLSNSVTTGVLSAVNRSFRSEDRIFHGFLQTDAAINPGNSGGPLLTAEGQLIGINTAIYNGAEGVGFAIPIDAAKRVVRELLTRGEVAPVWLGMDLQDLDPRLADVMGLPQRVAGALVSRVRPDGPAADAGVVRGDVVTQVAGTPIRAAREFYEILEHSTVGETLEVAVLHEGQPRKLRVRAAEIPAAALDELAEQLLGLRLAAAEGGGLVVERVRTGSGAEQIGIAAGDRILAVNGKPLPDTDALRRAALSLRGLSRALVVVQRGRGRYHVTVPLS
jgi:serine protease Do